MLLKVTFGYYIPFFVLTIDIVYIYIIIFRLINARPPLVPPVSR